MENDRITEIERLQDRPELVGELPCYRCGLPIGDAAYEVNPDALVRHFDCTEAYR